MVTIGVRVEPTERQRLEELAQECDLSLCAYLRQMIRMELARADRNSSLRESTPVAAPLAG
jgi:hypothetical protein